MRRLGLPPDGCWHIALHVWWRLYFGDGSPERCQRPLRLPPLTWDEEPEHGVAEPANG